MKGGGPRRTWVIVLWPDMAVVAVLAVVAVIIVWRITGPRDPPGADPEGSLVAQSVPSAPADMPTIGMYVLSEVQSSGDVTVSHWIRARTPIDRLDLLTADPDQLLGTVAAKDVVVLSADAAVLARRVSVGTRRQSVDLSSPAAELYLTYVVQGALRRTAPSAGLDDDISSVPGRSLARVTAMDVDYDEESGPVLRVIRGAGAVLNVACLSQDAAASTPPRPCGRAIDEGGWEVVLAGSQRNDRLLAQIEAAPAPTP